LGPTIGLPRSLLYHRYNVLWKSFFGRLGLDVVESPPSNRAILDRGIRLAVDETCLPLKILLGHVEALKDRADFILVPRIVSVERGETACVKFMGAYDVVRNLIEGVHLLEYNVDVTTGRTGRSEFCRIGRDLRGKPVSAWLAYERAKHDESRFLDERMRLQEAALDMEGMKVLVVGHGYNIEDELLGLPIIRTFEQLGVIPVAAEMHDRSLSRRLSTHLSSDIPWTYNKELLGAVEKYRERVDGIVFLVTFPCGPDSLMTELCVRKIKDKPVLVIVLDELQGEAGLRTRIESFVDLVQFRRSHSALHVATGITG
jgi:predicted nucleotide-binding protein (sugar kinase/HSP70/actin superfamily)